MVVLALLVHQSGEQSELYRRRPGPGPLAPAAVQMLASLHSMSRTVGYRLESVQSEAACFRGSPVFGDHMLLLGDTAGSEHTLAALQQAVLRRAREIYSAFAGAPKLSLDKALQQVVFSVLRPTAGPLEPRTGAALAGAGVTADVAPPPYALDPHATLHVMPAGGEAGGFTAAVAAPDTFLVRFPSEAALVDSLGALREPGALSSAVDAPSVSDVVKEGWFIERGAGGRGVRLAWLRGGATKTALLEDHALALAYLLASGSRMGCYLPALKPCLKLWDDGGGGAEGAEGGARDLAAIVSFKMEGQVTVCSVHRGHLRMLCLDPSTQLEAAVSLMEQIAEGLLPEEDPL